VILGAYLSRQERVVVWSLREFVRASALMAICLAAFSTHAENSALVLEEFNKQR
jgi:hypothetical protein